jgi:hypothetical protein
MTRDVRVPEEVSGTAFPCFALDGSTDKPARTDTERMDWLERRVKADGDILCGWLRADSEYDEFKGKHFEWPETFWCGGEEQDGQPFASLRAAIDAAMDAR